MKLASPWPAVDRIIAIGVGVGVPVTETFGLILLTVVAIYEVFGAVFFLRRETVRWGAMMLGLLLVTGIAAGAYLQVAGARVACGCFGGLDWGWQWEIIRNAALLGIIGSAVVLGRSR